VDQLRNADMDQQAKGAAWRRQNDRFGEKG
jgi:hypothetical protein